MRLALLSDIHGNLQALDACIAHARQQGVDQFAFLGDMVGYGAQPDAVLDCIMDLEKAGAIVLQGNHDAMAVQPPETVRTPGEKTAQWTHDHLTEAQRTWLDALPLAYVQDTLFLVHASPHEPARWHYLYDHRQAAAAIAAVAASTELDAVRFIFAGHVHAQTLFYSGADHLLAKFLPEPGIAIPVSPQRRWVATVGSVGQPRDGRPDAMYAMLDTQSWTLCFHRVAYDFFDAAQRIRAAGLPEFLAARLEHGR